MLDLNSYFETMKKDDGVMGWDDMLNKETDAGLSGQVNCPMPKETTLPELGLEKDGLPPEVCPLIYMNSRPKQPDGLIHGILRKGHKMLISGPSKAGKSFLLMELAVATSAGTTWLGFQCHKSRVMYVNLEIDWTSCIARIYHIYETLGIGQENMRNMAVWNLRGKAKPLNELLDALIKRIKRGKYDMVIVDPIYKVITGDENNATEMANFCNYFDKICDETGAAVVYSHHHSKGRQGAKRTIDRASGSGVFARDPDAVLDITPLQMPDEEEADGVTAWRMESSLREFPDIKPVNFYFQYPVHIVDTSGTLAKFPLEGSADGNLSKSPKRTTSTGRKDALDKAFYFSQDNGFAKISDMAEYIDCSEKTVRNYIKEYSKEYEIAKGIVTRKSEQQSTKENLGISPSPSTETEYPLF